jgi:hypothetical protein
MADVGSFELRDGDDEPLGVLLWRGIGNERGLLSFEPAKGLGADAAARLHQQLASAIATNSDLSSIFFRSPEGFDVKGWAGFWGFGCALRLAMKPFGVVVVVGEGDPPGLDAVADSGEGPYDWEPPGSV